MKKEGHPPYQEILFVDTATGTKFVCGSTLQPKERESFEGKEYPVYRVPISSASHPFFTGSQQFVDAEGRVDKFKKRYGRPAPTPAPISAPISGSAALSASTLKKEQAEEKREETKTEKAKKGKPASGKKAVDSKKKAGKDS